MSLRDLARDRSYESNITNTKNTITGAKEGDQDEAKGHIQL